ncbi:flagellar protein FlaG [Planococcus sp. YIM B11945]|uniref:flagellar protein FlaG n=1 Tax=Planococcus sp. YIM B11945 TaxID=3435410 RepID=UPI003D7CEFDF
MEVQNLPSIGYPKKLEPIEAVFPVQVLKEHVMEETIENFPKEKLLPKVEEMNEFLETVTTGVKFQLHEKLNVYYVQVINTNTEEVLKEIPSKKFLDMYASMAEFAGLIIDDKA